MATYIGSNALPGLQKEIKDLINNCYAQLFSIENKQNSKYKYLVVINGNKWFLDEEGNHYAVLNDDFIKTNDIMFDNLKINPVINFNFNDK